MNLSLRNLAIAAGLQVNRSHRKLDDDESIVEGMVMMMMVMTMMMMVTVYPVLKRHNKYLVKISLFGVS